MNLHTDPIHWKGRAFLVAFLLSWFAASSVRAQQVLVGQVYNGEHDLVFGYDPATNTVDTLSLLLANQYPSYNEARHPGAPVLAANGTIYGASPFGGRYWRGTVYWVDTVGHKRRTLCDFADSLLGKRPHVQLFPTQPNVFIGFTGEGGLNGMGTVFSFDASTTAFTKLLDLGPVRQMSSTSHLLQHSNGKVYIASEYEVSQWVYSYDPSTNIMAPVLEMPLNTGFHDLLELPDGRLAFCTTTGMETYAGSFQPDGTGLSIPLSFPNGGHQPDMLVHMPATNKLYAPSSSGGLGAGGLITLDLDNATWNAVHNNVMPAYPWMSSLVPLSDSVFVGFVDHNQANDREVFKYNVSTAQYTVLRADTSPGFFESDLWLMGDEYWFINARRNSYPDTWREDVMVIRAGGAGLDTLATTTNCGSPVSFREEPMFRMSDGRGLFVCTICDTATIVYTIDPLAHALDTVAILGSPAIMGNGLFKGDSLWIGCLGTPTGYWDYSVVSYHLYDHVFDTLAFLPGNQVDGLWGMILHGDTLIMLSTGSASITLVNIANGVSNTVYTFPGLAEPAGLMLASDGWYYGVTRNPDFPDGPFLYRFLPETATVEMLHEFPQWTVLGIQLVERLNDNSEPVIVGTIGSQAGFEWNLVMNNMAIFPAASGQCTQPWGRRSAVGLDQKRYGYTTTSMNGDTVSIYAYDEAMHSSECLGPITEIAGLYYEMASLTALYPDNSEPNVIATPQQATPRYPGVRYTNTGQLIHWPVSIAGDRVQLELYDAMGRRLWTTTTGNKGAYLLPAEIHWSGLGFVRMNSQGEQLGTVKVVDVVAIGQ
ncbi:MAG: choice-of-anchor tandem repeat GloVer-containing protein [Flavobacteriales bacterium]